MLDKLAGRASGRLRQRAEALMDREIRYLHCPSFNLPRAERFIVDVPGPDNSGPVVGSGHDLLTRREEYVLFRRLNYCQMRAWRSRAAIDPGRPKAAAVEEAERWLRQADQTRNAIIVANQGLVWSVAKRFAAPSFPEGELDLLVSEGNQILVRAVEGFDWRRGTKFGTYATRALMRGFLRYKIVQGRVHGRETSVDEHFWRMAGGRGGHPDTRVREAKETVSAIYKALDEPLDENQAMIIRGYYHFDKELPSSLEGLGRRLGFTKEWVRQLKRRAESKLRNAALAAGLDASY